MSDPVSHAGQVQIWIDRMRDGDGPARGELLNCACERLMRTTRKLLRGFPEVRCWEQTDDVLQNALLRLCRALDSVRLIDARHFFRLAALQIRRELIDLARHHRSGRVAGDRRAGRASEAHEPASVTHDPRGIVDWAEFHEQIQRLPESELAVFDLLWYHGLSQEDAADVLEIDVRTVKRRWRSARLLLHQRLGGERPGI